MRTVTRTVVSLGLLLALAGCSDTSAGDSFDLAEWDITGPSQLVSDGTIEVANSGSLPHTLVVTDSSGEVVGATELIEPGQTTRLELDLDDGRYSFTCRIVAQSPEGEIVDHFEAGMNTMVSVGG